MPGTVTIEILGGPQDGARIQMDEPLHSLHRIDGTDYLLAVRVVRGKRHHVYLHPSLWERTQ